MKNVIVLVLAGMLAAGAAAWGSGLAIPEQGAAAMGMSAAMTARNEDLSAIFYNPAGIDFVQGFEVMIGGTPIMPRHKYTPLTRDPGNFTAADAEQQVFLPPFLYAAWSMNRSLVLGLGVYAPYGLGTEWGEEWDGRYASTFAEIQTVHINPTMTWRPTNVFSIGAGMSYVTSSATIEKMIDTGGSIAAMNPALAALTGNPDYDSKFSLDGSGSGYGYNVGILYKPEDSKYQWGASYRSAYDIEYEGTAEFTHEQQMIVGTLTQAFVMAGSDAATAAAMAQGTYDTAIAGSMPGEQDGSATMHLPWMLNLGVRAQMSERLSFSGDIDVVGWNVYDKLVIDFDDDKPKDKLIQDKDWNNSYVLRGGAAYDMNESLVLRGGMLFDFNPVPNDTFDSQLPDSNRYGLSLGAGYRLGNFQIDASYLFLKFLDRDKKNGIGYPADITGDGEITEFDAPYPGYTIGNGTYESLAHMVSLSLGYSF